APVLRSCMRPFGEPTDAFGPEGIDYSIHGNVMSVGHGTLEGGCMADVIKYEANAPELAAQTVSLLVSDGSRTWDVEYLIPGTKLPDMEGAVVTVSYHHEFGGFGPIQNRLSVVNEK